MKKLLLVQLFILLAINLMGQNEALKSLTYDEYSDTPPIARGCDPNNSLEQIRNCFYRSISKQLVENLNTNVLHNQKLKRGDYTIYIDFTIDSLGKTVNIKVDFDNKKIVKAITKAMKNIDRLTPGYLNGKPVPINYRIPLKFKI